MSYPTMIFYAVITSVLSTSRVELKKKVAGVIETNRPDAKNAQYQDTVKQGDALLNRIQKLARVINV
ncbi:hypothetical protein DYB30_007188 [Aphanomyces astaci]|nr:hypothetical protein DYB30_007188 [Aphanomyces astaci]